MFASYADKTCHYDSKKLRRIRSSTQQYINYQDYEPEKYAKNIFFTHFLPNNLVFIPPKLL